MITLLFMCRYYIFIEKYLHIRKNCQNKKFRVEAKIIAKMIPIYIYLQNVSTSYSQK